MGCGWRPWCAIPVRRLFCDAAPSRRSDLSFTSASDDVEGGDHPHLRVIADWAAKLIISWRQL